MEISLAGERISEICGIHPFHDPPLFEESFAVCRKNGPQNLLEKTTQIELVYMISFTTYYLNCILVFPDVHEY